MADEYHPVKHHLHCHAKGALVRAPGRTAGECSRSDLIWSLGAGSHHSHV